MSLAASDRPVVALPTEANDAAHSAARRVRTGDLVLYLSLAGVVSLQVWLAFAKSINWDEFFHFHHLFEFASGTSARALQTLSLRPLGFLLEMPGSTIDRIVVARLFMLACEGVAALALYGVARKFADRSTALICVLGWLSAGSVLTHGFALRSDPTATALLIGAAWLLLGRPLAAGRAVAAGAALGLAGLVTVKAAFYAPLFLAIAWLQFRESHDFAGTLRRLAQAGVAAIATFAVVLLLHGMGLREAPVEASGKSLESAWDVVFSAGFLPQGGFLRQQAFDAPFFTLGLLAAPATWACQRCWRSIWPLAIGALLPLTTLLFYRNSFPYYFVFILAPASLALLPVIELMIARGVKTLLTLALLGNACWMAYGQAGPVMTEQRRLELGLEEIFPQRVPYVDFAGVIGDAPRVLPFLTSGWGLENYRRGGRDLIVERMEREAVPLLITNHFVLADAVAGRVGPEALRVADREALRTNFIPHWGPVWVAGKRIAPGAEAGLMTIAVPGVYTLEGASLTIGGMQIRPGQWIRLDRGEYRVVPDPRRTAVLRWGRHLARPSFAAPGPNLFTEF